MAGTNRPIQLGDNVKVASGPHEGRGGRVERIQSIIIGYADPEPYAIVQYPDESGPGGYDSVSVPVRRLQLR